VPVGGLPSGTVTFLFTDIEGSTELLKLLGRDRFERVLAEHDGVLRAAVAASGGWVVDTQGDSLFCAFRSAGDAVSAAIAAQRALAAHEWPEQVRVRIRMGLHSGEPKAGEERYVGIGVHRAARIGAAAHGGQVLVSETTRALVSDDLPAGVLLRDLGVHRLKDIDEPVRLYQVIAAGLEDRFPALRTLPRGRSRRARLVLVVAALAVTGAAAAAIALLLTGPASAKPVRLVANSIAVFDPKSGKPVGEVPLAFSPTDVDAGGDEIWVLNSSARTATAIDPSTLKVIQTVGIDGYPYSQYAAGGTEWVAFAGGVDEIASSPDGGGVTKISLWRPPNLRGTDGQPCYAYVTGDGRNVWVSEGQNVAVVDAASGSVRRKLLLPAAAGAPPDGTCYGLRYTDGHLLAVQDPGGSVGTVDLHSGSYAPAATDLGGLVTLTYGSANWASGFGSDWIGTYTVDATTGRQVNSLERLDPVTGAVITQIGTGIGGNLAVDPGSGLWVVGVNHGLQDAALIHIDPTSSRITSTTRLHHYPCCPNDEVGNAIAVGHGRLWVALDSP
jgi:class 3 adenylate cyclase